MTTTTSRMHTLPMELIRRIFEFSATSPSTTATLSRVCRTAHTWMLPTLYNTIVLTTPQAAEQFARSILDEADIVIRPRPHSFIRHLWIGPSAAVERMKSQSNPSPSPTVIWPVKLVKDILSLCTSLYSLSLTCIPPDVWDQLILAIPPSVQDLTLGPAHSRIDWMYLPCAPNLRKFTSVSTVMVNSEFQGIACAPRIQSIRRVFRSLDAKLFSLCLKQLDGVDQTSTLQGVELVGCGGTVDVGDPDAACGAKGLTAPAARGMTRFCVVVPGSPAVDEVREDVVALVFQDWTARRSQGLIPQ